MNIKSIIIAIALLTAAELATAQASYITISSSIRLPKDSTESARLLTSLNQFLTAAQQSADSNPWILPTEKAETDILLDQFKAIIKTREDADLYKPYLTNALPIDPDHYHIQLSYMGIKEHTPILRASFELIAHRHEDTFLFSSLLARNTKDWKTLTIGNVTFHYQNQVYQNLSEIHAKHIAEFDAKLHVNQPTEYYFCDDYEDATQLRQLIGVQYRADYNGIPLSTLGFIVDGKLIHFYHKGSLQDEQLDPHDLFHSRANLVIPPETRNHLMICGCAYIYGGSYGISWDDIQSIFNTTMLNDKKTDWLKLYIDRYKFHTTPTGSLYVTEMINALIMRKVEKEKGFSAAMELMASGNYLKEREHFFAILEKTTGINEKNFNKQVWKLINDEK